MEVEKKANMEAMDAKVVKVEAEMFKLGMGLQKEIGTVNFSRIFKF